MGNPENHTSTLVVVGAGIVQWLERWTRDRKVVGLNPCWSGGRIFFGGYSKTCYKKLFTHVESHASAVSLLKSGE